MSISANLSATVTTLLSKFGSSAELKKKRAEAYSTSTGLVTKTETPVNLKIFVEDHKVKVDNEMVLTGDKQIYVSAVAISSDIEPSDVIVQGTDLYTILSISFLSVEGVDVLAVVRAKRT